MGVARMPLVAVVADRRAMVTIMVSPLWKRLWSHGINALGLKSLIFKHFAQHPFKVQKSVDSYS
jgi:hypothetical protein